MKMLMQLPVLVLRCYHLRQIYVKRCHAAVSELELVHGNLFQTKPNYLQCNFFLKACIVV